MWSPHFQPCKLDFGWFLINRQQCNIISNVITACPRKLTLSPGGPIGPGGPGNPGVPYREGSKQVKHCSILPVWKRILVILQNAFLEKSCRFSKKQETRAKHSTRHTVAAQSPSRTQLETQTRVQNGNNGEHISSLPLCCFTLAHLRRHYKGNYSDNTWQMEDKATSRPTHCSAWKSWLSGIPFHPLATLE